MDANRTFQSLFTRSLFFLFLVSSWSCSSSDSAPESAYRWQVVYSEQPEASFRGISAVNDSTCWVSGSGGTILRTTDGGQSWQRRPVPGADSLDFRDIEAFGADTAVAMSIGSGGQSRIYRTTDGGGSWRMVHQNPYEEGFYDAIAFWDNGYGLLQGDPVDGRLFILRSEDGGATWREIPRTAMPQVAEQEYAFAASGTQLVTGAGGRAWIGTGGARARVLRTNDYGQHWQAYPTPIMQGESSTGLFSLAFRDSLHGIGVGGDYSREGEGGDNVIVTQDGGRSWTLLEEAGLHFRSAIRYATDRFIAAGPSGSEYSAEGGKRWIPIGGPGFHTVSVGKGGLYAVWAAGREGRIARLVRE